MKLNPILKPLNTMFRFHGSSHVKTGILLLAILFIPVLSIAQTGTVNGHVYDAETGLPLADANIVVADTRAGSTVDTTGFYSITDLAAGTYTLRATLVGYTPQEQEFDISSGETITIDFFLEERVSALEEIMVTHRSEAAEVREGAFPVAVLDGQRLAGRGITLDEAINRATGVQVRRSGGLGSASVFNIRGLEGQRIQVYVNGNAANVAGDAFSLDDIPIQLVERVEVYKGIVPARFGGDGLGAAINVVTIEPEGGYLDGGYTIGSFGQHQISVTGQYDLGWMKAGASVNIDRAENDYEMDNPYRPGLRIKRENDRFGRTVAGVVLKTDRLGFDEVELEGAVFDIHRDIQGLQTNVQHAHTKNQLGVLLLQAETLGALDGRFDVSLGFIGMRANSALIDTSRFRYDFDGSRFQSPSGRGELSLLPAHSDNRTDKLRHRAAFTYRFGTQRENIPVYTANFTYTLDLARHRPKDPLANEYAGRNVSEFPGDQASAVAGLSHEWRPWGKQFVAVTGLRGYAFHASGTESSLQSGSDISIPPRVTNRTLSFGASQAFRYRFSLWLMGKMSVELARRLPSPNELFGDGQLIIPSPNLFPEQSLNLNTGIYIDRLLRGGRSFQAEINAFWMKLDDMINLSGGIAGRANHINFGEVRIAGFDAEVKGDFTRWLYGQAGITFQDARDVMRYEPGTAIPNPTYNLRIPHQPWLFGSVTLEAHRPDLFGQSQQSRLFAETTFTEEYFYAFEMSRRQERRIPRSVITTVGIEQAWLNAGLTLSAEVQNITDAQVLNLFNQPLPGRMFRVKLRYTLIGD